MSTNTAPIDHTLQLTHHYVDAVEFFLEHAGYSIAIGETEAQGKRRSAEALARAEIWAEFNGLSVQWEDDWNIGSHVREYGRESYPEEPEECECAVLVDSDGHVLGAMGCVDDATNEYRRVVAAEIASDAMTGNAMVAS